MAVTSCGDVRIWVSTRRSFRDGDEGWPRYIEFIGLPELREVRSLDPMLNEYVQCCGSHPLRSYGDLAAALDSLPRPSGKGEYHLLFVEAEHGQAPPAGARCSLLGHDLSDETHTSSVLNCGPWTGELAPFTERLNGFGLLTLADAVAAKSILPRVWPGDPHANVTVWALYEVEPARLART